MADPAIGVVVIGRNEGARLIACLASLTPLGLPIVYVDSGSTDGSRDAARAAGASVVALDLAVPFTAARARNAGAAVLLDGPAPPKYIQFIDGDCAIAPGWIEQARDFLEAQPDYAVACGRRRERDPDASLYNRLADIEWDTPVGDAAACGGDSLMRTAAFAAVGGFDDALIAGEEPELCARLRTAGWRIYRLDAEMTLHDIDMHSFRSWWRRCVRGGYAYAEVSRVSARHGSPIFRRELLRAVNWGLVLPFVTIVLGLFWFPLILLLPIVLVAQVIRLTWRYSHKHAPVQYAVLITLSKFAETAGILRFYWKRLWRRDPTLIEYK